MSHDKKNLKTQCSEYMVIYQDDLYIASPTPEVILNILQDKYKLDINPDFYLGAKYPIDPGGAMICQLRKYLKRLHVNIAILFKENLPKDLTFLEKMLKRTLSRLHAVALRMYLTLHLLLFAQSM